MGKKRKAKERAKALRATLPVMEDARAEEVVLYTPAEREIFPFFDGHSWRWADPIAIRRRMALALVPHGLSIEKALEQCRDKDEPTKLQAKEFVAGAARIAFDMPCNPGAKSEAEYGASENQVIDALNAYIAFNKKKATNGVKSQTSPPSTDSTPSEPGVFHSPSSMPAGLVSAVCAPRARGSVPTGSG
jgi:hypothetical protein